MRPMLKPALVPMWRSDSALQLGLDPAHARVVEGFTETGRLVLGLLDGSRDLDQIRAEAGTAGADRSTVDRLLDTLSRCSLLDDAALDAGPLRELDPGSRDRLAPELSALSLLRPGPGAATATLGRRRQARLAVAGPAVLTDRIAELLESAGVAQVGVYASLTELAPHTVGRRAPDFVVLATVGLLDLTAFAVLDNLTLPHLAVSVRELTGIVGPLVLPGSTSCLHCQELQRADRDPRWPSLSLQFHQLTAGLRCPATLAAMVAATATMQVLSHLDGDLPATIEGSLEVTLPDWRLRRRSWHRHPECPCVLSDAG
ncbi:MAG: hypothetical protein QOE76_2003 [Frankiales bacterium]|nr:hypothetical protein [Frankiales bacterium]